MISHIDVQIRDAKVLFLKGYVKLCLNFQFSNAVENNGNGSSFDKLKVWTLHIVAQVDHRGLCM